MKIKAMMGVLAALFSTTAWAATVNLAEITGDIVAKNGDILTGTLDGATKPYKITIAANATVTLKNAVINGSNNWKYEWAGITCEQDCKIILDEGSENAVTGFDEFYPGIHISEDYTLTISGKGSLNASSNGYGAGIGGGYRISCGNIVINGGTITATGGEGAAGIGGAYYADCGNITISGGTITATGGEAAAGIGGSYSGDVGDITISGGTVTATGGDYATGIGSGYGGGAGNIVINGGTVIATGGNQSGSIGSSAYGAVGDITITGNETSVTATKGDEATYTIGDCYEEGECGSIKIGLAIDQTIELVETPNIPASPFIYPVEQYTTVTFDPNKGTGEMPNQYVIGNPMKPLKANTFTYADHIFIGWNTKADGSGSSYGDQDIVDFTEAGNFITLYAQWIKGNVIDISTLKNNINVSDGIELKGTLSGNYKISIIDGATVTLNNVTINGTNDENYAWAGITCLGECSLILKGKNTVKGFYREYPGIYVPENKTLTISGKGSLDASSNGEGAGIGGGYEISCGNIVINSGTVTATGGDYAAAIGSGYNGVVGNITISKADTKVTAIKSQYSPYSIGEGLEGSHGTITFNGIESPSIIASPFTYPSRQYTVTLNANGSGEEPISQTTLVDPVLKLNANPFTREGFSFIGWNTKADGSGDTYVDQALINLAEIGSSIKLYAQWFEGDATNISGLAGNYTAQDGEVLTGSLGGNYKISIADGATVTLNNVLINGINNDNYKWAGISCEGDCHIILAENSVNTVKGFYLDYPGIHVPSDYTLTISGTGSLDASANGYGAGIGCGYMVSCGNIVIDDGTITAKGGNQVSGIGGGGLSFGKAGNITINGGTITATGNRSSAGIGCGSNGIVGDIEINGGIVTATGGEEAAGIGIGDFGKSGNITINGGTVIATGGYYASGIGGSFGGTIGNITISENVTKVKATKGDKVPYSLGKGKEGEDTPATVGTITIGGFTYTDGIARNPFVYPSAIKLVKSDGKLNAIIDGNYEETDAIYIPEDTPVDTVIFNREFLEVGRSTLVLPFNIAADKIEGASKIMTFHKVDLSNAKVYVDYVWCADGVSDPNCPTKNNTIRAYTPYIVEMAEGTTKLIFHGALTLEKVPDYSIDYRLGDWTFRPMLQYKKWEAGDPELTGCGENKDKSCAYGFASGDVSKELKTKGTFVRLVEDAYINPFRCYLLREPHAAAGYPEIPDFDIVVKEKSGETTVIGKINTRSGEIMLNRKQGSFDIKGRHVNNGKHAAKGIYLKK